MLQRSAFAIAAALTAFLLMVAGALVTHVSQESTPAPTTAVARQVLQSPADSAPLANRLPTPDLSDLKAAIAEREAAYQSLLEEANRKIQEANTQMEKQAKDLEKSQVQIKAAKAQLAAVAPTAAPPPPHHALTPERAAQIAVQAAPSARLVRAPELVLFQGVPAYEIQLDLGLVYIHADTGQVLHNGAVPSAAAASRDGPGDVGNPPSNGHDEHEVDREHDEHSEREHAEHESHPDEHGDD